MSDTVIALEDVTKTYRAGAVDVPVLKGVALAVEANDYIAISGRSGAGKSTLMHILGCLDRPTTGRCLVRGRDVSALDDDELSRVRSQTIGFVFQQFHLLASRTIVENVALPMEYRSTSAKHRRERAVHWLERVGLGHRLRHRPSELSGGEKQRVAIARALANEPSVLLADEPTGNLDVASQESILALFSELHDELGVATVLVTHDPSVAAVARRRVRVTDGRVEEVA